MNGLPDGGTAAKFGLKSHKLGNMVCPQCFLACPNFQHVWHCLGLGMSSFTVTFSKPTRTEAGIDLLSKVMQAHVSLFRYLLSLIPLSIKFFFFIAYLDNFNLEA